MFFMYDSVNLDQIPAEPHAVLSYINGEYANHEEAVKRFPHARHIGISVTGDVPASAYDIEAGDYSVDDVPRLYEIAKSHDIWRPCFYGQLSGVMPGIKAKLNTVSGITRSDVRLMVAYYDEIASLPSGYDAHQFTETALGRNLDESICASDFFQPVKPTVAPKVEIVERAVITFKDGAWSVEKEPSTGTL